MWDKVFKILGGAGRMVSKVIKILVTGCVILGGIALLVSLIPDKIFLELEIRNGLLFFCRKNYNSYNRKHIILGGLL